MYMDDELLKQAHSEIGRRLGLARRTHGHSGGSGGRGQSPEYQSWRAMKRRCLAPADRSYPRYGGRGIAIDPRWLGREGFATFLADMGPRPEGMTLDRIDSDGPYSPSNCRWAMPSEQARNRVWDPAPAAQAAKAARPVAYVPKELPCAGGCGATVTAGGTARTKYCPDCKRQTMHAAHAAWESRLTALCSVEACDRLAHTRGWCKAHYLRWRYSGDAGTSPIRSR